jgi:hypothetical protein
MQFRWVAVIALYTFLIGPVFDHPGIASQGAKQTRAAQPRALPATHPRPGERATNPPCSCAAGLY